MQSVRQAKINGNAMFQAGDFEGAEGAYSDGVTQMAEHATEAVYARRFRAGTRR